MATITRRDQSSSTTFSLQSATDTTIQPQSYGPRQALSQMSQLANFSGYIQTRSIQETKLAASPVATGTYTGRDATTGQSIIATPAGGILRAGAITSGAMQRGAVIPRLTTSRRGTGYADSMPARIT